MKIGGDQTLRVVFASTWIKIIDDVTTKAWHLDAVYHFSILGPRFGILTCIAHECNKRHSQALCRSRESDEALPPPGTYRRCGPRARSARSHAAATPVTFAAGCAISIQGPSRCNRESVRRNRRPGAKIARHASRPAAPASEPGFHTGAPMAVT
jgi:hypothetical protein